MLEIEKEFTLTDLPPVGVPMFQVGETETENITRKERDLKLMESLRDPITREKGLEQVFNIYAPQIYRYTQALTGNPGYAESLVGDTFAQLSEKLAEGGGPSKNLRSYLYQTVYHLVVDGSRDEDHLTPFDDVAKSVAVDTDEPLELQIEKKLMYEAFIAAMNADLTDDQRHVIFLRFLGYFSLEETAEIMGKEVNNIKVIQNRGIAKLRKTQVFKEVQ